jgi:hypothetical protein
VFRAAAGENRKRRPPYYSKLRCLASFVRAVERCPEVEVVFLNDGEMPPERLELMKVSGEVVSLPPLPPEQRTGRMPLFRSCMSALELVEEREWSDADVVYFAEDDYLYLPEAFERLVEGVEWLEQASYFTFYAAVEWSRSRPYWANEELWHTAEATTSTFGARVGALRADLPIHRLAFRVGNDTHVCLAYQGIRPYRWSNLFGELLFGAPGTPSPLAARAKTVVGKFGVNLLATKASLRPHVLVVPFRPLATHVELPYLAKGVDWGAVAEESARWLDSRTAFPQP